MSLKLRDSTGSVYTFPATFDLAANSVKLRINDTEIAYSHGGRELGDGKLNTRTLIVSGMLYAATETAFQTAYDSLTAACLKTDQYFLYDDLYHIKIKRIAAIDCDFVPGAFNLVAQVRVKLYAEDPRWYSETLSLMTYTITTDPYTATFTNGGVIETHPRITMRRTNAYEQVQLSNLDGACESLVYADTGFSGLAGGGTSVDMDCSYALATRGSTDVRQYVTGNWPALAAGGNDFLVEGLSGGTLIFAWRNARI